jgi:hypothetical protein
MEKVFSIIWMLVVICIQQYGVQYNTSKQEISNCQNRIKIMLKLKLA